jgi:hypothetical protein
VQDSTGRWVSPTSVIRHDPRTPPLPPGLSRPTYEPPRSRVARDFVEAALEVEVLTPRLALDSVLALQETPPGAPDPEAVLTFLRSLWRTDPGTITTTPAARLSRVLVPARALGRRAQTGYARAGSVYFDRLWTGHELLERLYGAFRREEFLACDPPDDGRTRQGERRFWMALGVADAPRMLPVDVFTGPLGREWRTREDIRRAMECPDSHTGTARRFEGTALDRLDEVLQRGDERSLRALARHLSRVPDPLGEPVHISCTHGAHERARGRPRANKAMGFQHWLLTTIAWLASDGGPGGRKMRRPDQVWTDVPRGPAQAILPSPTEQLPNPTALGLPSVHRPEIGAVEAAMQEAERHWPDLAAAPTDIRDGLGWLLKKLDAAALRDANARGRQPVPVPAEAGHRPCWSTGPLVADLPGVDQVSELALLPPSPWTGLQRAYGLERASDVVEATVVAMPQPGARELLSRQDRVRLLALLISRGGEIGSLASRLGHLTDMRVSELTVRYQIRGRRWTDQPAFHLQPGRDARRRITGTLRSRTALTSADLVRLGQVLAQHVGLPDAGDLIGQYLTVRQDLLVAHGILDTQLAEAGQALRRYRSDRIDESAEEHAEAEEDEPPVASRTPEAVEPAVGPPGGPDGTTGSPAGATAEDRALESALTGQREEGRSPDAPPVNRGEGREAAAPAPRRDDVSFGTAAPQPAGPRSRGRGPGTAAAGSPRHGDRAGAGTYGSPVSGSSSRDDTELAAEDIAISFLRRRYAAHVERVGHLKLGWDLTATLPAGDELLVEVKGFAVRSPDFVITRRELGAARQRSGYRLCVVTGVAGTSGTLAWFDDVPALVQDKHLSPYQWVVHDWAAAAHELHPWGDG